MTVQEALKILEIQLNDFPNVKNPKTFEEAKLFLEEFKTKIKNQRRKLAKKYHPDLNPENAEKMKQINNICDELLKTEVVAVQPRIATRVVIIRNDWQGTTSTTVSYY